MRTVAEMTDPERIDFASQMAIVCMEEASLWEVPSGSIDHIAPKPVSHGPWMADDCAHVLTHWFDAGLVGLYRRVHGEVVELGDEDARGWLVAPDRWVIDERTPNLFVTDAGRSLTPESWRDVLPPI